MKNRQVNFMAMCQRVSGLMNKYTDLFQEFSVFSSLQNSFDSNLSEMQRLGELQTTIITGYRIKKANLKLNLARNTMQLSCSAEAYALTATDFVLQKKIHRAETHLLKLSDVNFMTSCGIVYQAARQYREVLDAYGVNEESLSNLKTAMDDYRAVMDAPKEAIIARKQLTHELDEQIAGQRVILDKLDSLIGITLAEKPAILAEYWHTRKVLYRSRALVARCRVTDAVTGKGVEAADITFALNEVIMLQKSTYKAGGANIKSLKEGTYTVTVARPCYISQTLMVTVTKDKLTRIEVQLVKN
jgi:hypothetical protein